MRQRNQYQLLDTPAYTSMFVPQDLSIIQNNLQQSQQRYDQANQGWAQTKAALIADPTYDPQAKREILESIDRNFGEIYKSYNGDMGAGQNDILGLIAAHRNNPYFELNRKALEQQKRYNALKDKYGSTGMEEFGLGMSKSLRTADGKWISDKDLEFDVEGRLARPEKRLALWKTVLGDEHYESGIGPDGMSYTRLGIGEDQIKSKVDTVLNEYINTAEGYQDERTIERDLGFKRGSDESKAELRKRVLDSGMSFMNPGRSVEYSAVRAEPRKRVLDSVQYTSLVKPSPSTEGGFTNSENYFPTVEDFRDEYKKNDASTVKGAMAKQIGNAAVSDIKLVKLREKMRATLKKYGVNDNFYFNGLVKKPIIKFSAFVSRAKTTDLSIQSLGKRNAESQRIYAYNKEFDKLVNQYDYIFDQKVSSKLTGDFPQNSKWVGYDAGNVYNNALKVTGSEEIAKKASEHADLINKNLNKTFDGVNIIDYTVSGGPAGSDFAKLSPEDKIKKMSKFKSALPGSTEYEELSSYNNAITPVKTEWIVAGNNVSYRVTNKHGITYTVTPNNSTSALKHATATLDDNVIKKATSQFYRFVGDKYFTIENGKEVPHQMPGKISTSKLSQKDAYGNDVYQIFYAGNPITVARLAAYLDRSGQGEAYRTQIKQVYGVENVDERPALMTSEYDLGKAFNIINE